MNIDDYKQFEFTPPIRELYIQTQHWARHNENLIIATNGLVLSGMAAIVTTVLKNNQALDAPYLFLLGGISFLGLGLTIILNQRYLKSIERLVSYEALFGFHEDLEENEQNKKAIRALEKGCSTKRIYLVPSYLHKRPKVAPESVWFFGTAHAVACITIFIMLLRVYFLAHS